MKAPAGIVPDQDTERLRQLALVYLRHADAPRALALGISALRYGPATPNLMLLIANAFLKVGEPEQALAALSRFETPETLLSRMPSEVELVAYRAMTARALHRLGHTEAARDILLPAEGEAQ